MKDEFLLWDGKLEMHMLDAKNHDWLWRRAADCYSDHEILELDLNMFWHNISYPDELRNLNPEYQSGFKKLKNEFIYIRSAFKEAFAKLQKSGQADQDSSKQFEDGYVFSSTFIDFCNGDMCLHYFYCVSAKYELLKSAAVTMPLNAAYTGENLRVSM